MESGIKTILVESFVSESEFGAAYSEATKDKVAEVSSQMKDLGKLIIVCSGPKEELPKDRTFRPKDTDADEKDIIRTVKTSNDDTSYLSAKALLEDRVIRSKNIPKYRTIKSADTINYIEDGPHRSSVLNTDFLNANSSEFSSEWQQSCEAFEDMICRFGGIATASALIVVADPRVIKAIQGCSQIEQTQAPQSQTQTAVA